MYGTPMPDTFILLDTLEYNTIRVPTQFVTVISIVQWGLHGVRRSAKTPTQKPYYGNHGGQPEYYIVLLLLIDACNYSFFIRVEQPTLVAVIMTCLTV
jgi:hypothetical protein